MCLYPRNIWVSKNNGSRKYVTVTCGKCIECVKRYQNDWMLRLTEEYKDWSAVYFATITYNDDNIPYVPMGLLSSSDTQYISKRLELNQNKFKARYLGNSDYDYLFKCDRPEILVPTLCKSDIQNFMKRLRINFLRKYGIRLKCKYFIVGEYGNNTYRPHYHIVFFCNQSSLEFQSFFKETWHFGKVYDLHLISWKKDGKDVAAVMRYVSKYCAKPHFFENPYVLKGIVMPSFRLISNGIGSSYRFDLDYHSTQLRQQRWTKEIFDKIIELTRYYYNGYFYPIPRYWREWLYPHNTFTTTHIDYETGEFSERKTYRKDTEDSFSLLFDKYVQLVNTRLRDEQLREVARRYGDPEDPKVLSAAHDEIVAVHKSRARDALRQMFKTYYKGSQSFNY